MATRGNHEIRMLRSRICMESDSNGCAWRLATQISKIMDGNEVKREKLTTRRRLVWSCLGLLLSNQEEEARGVDD
jgi:hypothetical protein